MSKDINWNLSEQRTTHISRLARLISYVLRGRSPTRLHVIVMPNAVCANRVTIKSYAEAKVRISVRSDGQLTLTIDDKLGRHRFTGDEAEIGGFIVGWMVPAGVFVEA